MSTVAGTAAEFLARSGVRRIYGLTGSHFTPVWAEATVEMVALFRAGRGDDLAGLMHNHFRNTRSIWASSQPTSANKKEFAHD
ncbi:hypothetical protein [Sphaerisporangium sp. NPDC051011]|uniref:hypothetical protein n=1 Tax=Sphaerisporangium sp. NPDC051011 TaxID=3155792 RepID=UPI0033DCE8B4